MSVTTKDGVMAVIGAAKEDETAISFVYGSESKLETGLKSNVSLNKGEFTMVVDEPTTMPGGTNAGPNPLDLFCGSLGTCQEITYKLYATVMDIDVKSVSATVSAPCNLNGLVGLGGKVGFEKVNVTIDLDAGDTPPEKLDQLKGAVDAHCPLVATLKNPMPVSTTLVHTKAAAAKPELADDPTRAEDIKAVIAAGQEDAKALAFVYSSTSKLATGGLTTELEMPQGHKMTIDEPAGMPGGNNKGPNPLDVFCASVGTCQEITYKLYAQVMGVPVNSIACKVEAPTDLRGLVGLADDLVAPKAVNITVTIDSPADMATLEKLKAAVDAHCPLLDTLKGAIDVELAYKKK